MHNWFDQFVKEVLHEAFDALGTARQEVEVSADAQRIDFFFVPDPAQLSRPPGAVGSPQVPFPERAAPAEPAQVPPIFARMARTACLLEHYVPRLLVRLRLAIPEAAPLSDVPPEDKELLVTVDEYLQQVEEKGRQQGIQQGVQQGIQQGVQQGVQHGLEPLLHLCARRLGRPLRTEERTRFLARLDTLGPDRLGDAVLDLAPPALAAWLSDPDAR